MKETDNKFKVLFEQEQKDRIKWQEEAKKWETLFDKLHDVIEFETRRDSVGPTEEPEACIKRIIHERDQWQEECGKLGVTIDELAFKCREKTKDCVKLKSQLDGYKSALKRAWNDEIQTISAERDQLKGQLAKFEEAFTERVQRETQDYEAMAAQLEAWQRCSADANATHVNMLRGTIAYSRQNALHYAGATDYDQLKAQLDAANAACAEMRAVVQHAYNWKIDLLPKHTNLVKDLEHALSTSRGRGYINASELTPTIELLERWLIADERCDSHSWPALVKATDDELQRLKALKEGK